jgi:hypothetical protein
MGGHIVQQGKISTAKCSWMNLLNVLQEAIHHSFIKFCIYCFALWYKFFVHYALRVGKNYQCGLDVGLWELQFFGPWDFGNYFFGLWELQFFSQGDVSPTHSELCALFRGCL